jgi:hypothetical protein
MQTLALSQHTRSPCPHTISTLDLNNSSCHPNYPFFSSS